LGAEYCINLCDMMWRMWIDAGFEMFVSHHSGRLEALSIFQKLGTSGYSYQDENIDLTRRLYEEEAKKAQEEASKAL